MSEQTIDKPEMPEQLSDILLVLDKELKRIRAVKGIGKNGELETVEADRKNRNQFMRVDKHGDIFSNFFSNFLRQLKDPTRFRFFKVPQPLAVDLAAEMQRQAQSLAPEGQKLMKEHEIAIEPTKDLQQKKQNYMETTPTTVDASEYRYRPDQIDWETMSNLGLSKERLEKMNLLDPLLKGYKTNELVPISLNLGTAITRMDARLSLQNNDDGQVVMAIHGIRKVPTLHFPFFGHEFTQADKESLLTTGNMGRIVDLTNPKTGDIIPSIVSVDRLTNELVALRSDKIRIPDEIKGIKLSDEQKSTLLEGKPLYIEGMISKKGKPFNANVQFNADKRYVEFLFNRSISNKIQQEPSLGVPRTFRGKELDDSQYQKFKAGQTIYITGLKDKQGKEYKGYITFNKQTGKTGFSFNNPNKMRESVQPANASKTQVAVNSDGKTNESTKNIKEPLNSEQISHDNKKQRERLAEPKTLVKSKGRKI